MNASATVVIVLIISPRKTTTGLEGQLVRDIMPDIVVDSPRIVRIELTPVLVPFNTAVREAMQAGEGGLGMAIGADEPWEGGEFVIARLTAEDGSVGLGEAFVWLPETGVASAQVIGIIEQALHKYILSRSPFEAEKILTHMDRNVTRNEVAKGLLDMACYDLMGKIHNLPASDFMGGVKVTRIPLAALIPLMDPDDMVGMAVGFQATGTRTFRVKLGRSAQEDVEIMEKMRTRLGDQVRLRVDYNQAYSEEEAVQAIRAIEQFGIDFAEQPVAADNFVGMAQVQKRVKTPLMAHEGCFSFQDIVTLVELGAIGVVGINSERPGGVTRALQAIDFAKQHQLNVVVHNQPLGISSAMHLHVSAARYDCLGHDPELFGYVMMEDDLIAEPIDYSDGSAAVPSGAGFGVELDQEALDRYASGPTVTLGG
jgi:muconate cycloisomerase